MPKKPAETIRESLDRLNKKPRIDFDHNPNLDSPRPWVCSIQLHNGEYHGGEGATQCEALILAAIHWAMHGETK